jgi:hypothetical protein
MHLDFVMITPGSKTEREIWLDAGGEELVYHIAGRLKTSETPKTKL